MMKRFKFWLVWIVLGIFWLISFSSADFTNILSKAHAWITLGGSTSDVHYTLPYSISNNSFICFRPSNNKVTCSFTWFSFWWGLKDFCYYYTWPTINLDLYCSNTNSSNSFLYHFHFSNPVLWDCPECEECETCPEINTWDILSWSCDTNYCVENDLCPVASNFSQLFINDIEHQSAPLINITIPYEYTWDSSVNSWQFDLVISWQNVDYDYIDNIVRTQNSKPSTEDFNNIITWLIPLFIPWLVIILFIWFVFKFIKKIF